MRRFSLPLALGVGLIAGATGCRASDSECIALAEHVVGLATAEGRPTSGTAKALEDDCKRLRPTSGLIDCMMAATSLADVDAC